jgi:hypothetical protein
MDETTRRVSAGDTARNAEDDVDRRTTEIRQDIEQTREEMSETIEAIQERLTPRNIVANAAERVKSATKEGVRGMTDRAADTADDAVSYTRETAGGLMDTVRENPIPAALIGIGAAWLLTRRNTSRSWRREERWRDDSWRSPDYGEATGMTTRAYDADAYDDDRYRNGGVVDRIRENPVPAAMAGIGLGWLAFAGGSDTPRGRRVTYGSGYDYRGMAAGDSTNARSRWTEATDETAAAETGSASIDVSESASRVASRAREYVDDASRTVRRTRRRAQNGLQRMVEENPILVGAGALIAGAAVGLAIPETERENEWMGEARDTVVDRAQDAARNAASQVQTAIGGAVMNAASETITGADDKMKK